MSADVHPLSASLRGGESGANYEILGKLATGGMAELFLARAPTSSGRPGPVVVLKRILPHLAEDPEFIRMFRDEAYLAATLRHPNIVQVFDIGKRGEDYFFTMEYVHGENLRAILRSAQKRGESIPLTHILTIALGITAALHHAHEQTDDQGQPLHIVHRDVSPTNVLVAYDGSVKIVDFGIAKAAAGTHVTQAGMLKGKASYMSPEQCRAGQVDRRSDVFAIGILLYEMTTLTRLFKGENELAILHQVLSGAVDPPSQRRPGYPPELERIILRALANEPGNRYATAEELQADLMRFGQQNNLRPSNPALGQFLRGLFGNKPLPWADNPKVGDEGGNQGGMNVVRGAPPSPPQPPAPPASQPAGRGGGPRPARGPGSRAPAAKAWRPGGRGKAPPPPPPSSLPPPPTGPTTAKQVRLGQQQAHPASRPTAPRSAVVAKPARPTAGRPPARPAAPPRPSAASYAPPPPDYDLDPEESKTAIATPRPDFGFAEGHGESDPMQEAKTRVSGTTADDVAAFIAAAPVAELGVDDAATRVAPKRTEDAVAAFLAAAPPADLVGDNPSPMMVKTQVAPATAAEIKALADAAAKAAIKPAAQDLFSTPAAPTRPGGKPAGSSPPSQPQSPPASASPRPSLPAPSDLPPPGGRPAQARPAVPSPSDLPPPGGRATPSGATQVPASSSNRRDTIMNAPAQPAALGGPSRTAPPSNNPLLSPVEPDIDDLATVRLSVDQALHVSGRAPAGPSAASPNQTVAMNPPTAAELGLAQHQGQHPGQQHGQPGYPQPYAAQGQSPLGPPQAPIQHWQNAPQQHMPSGHTVPMPMTSLEDDPIVVPGRNAKLIAMVVTVVVGLSLGATGVWLFLID